MRFSFENYRRYDVHLPNNHAEEQVQEHLVEIFENSDDYIVMQINIRINNQKLSRSLDETGRRQLLPFAFAKTLNRTTRAVEKYTVARTYPRSLNVHNKSFFAASMFKGDAVGVRKPVYQPWKTPRGVLGGGSVSRD